MRVGIREWSQAIVVFLPRGIPQSQLNVLAINFNIRDVVLEDCWDVDLRSTDRRVQWLNTGRFAHMIKLTSGNVPLENTINKQVWKGGQRRIFA